MEAWALSLLTVGCSAVITTLLTLCITRILNKQFKKKDSECAFLEDQRVEEQIKMIKKVVKDELETVKADLTLLKESMINLEEGTLSSLRNDILTCYYRCVEKGYRNDYDYTNIYDMYNAYTELDGNSFIQDIMTRFSNLPTKEANGQAGKKIEKKVEKKVKKEQITNERSE